MVTLVAVAALAVDVGYICALVSEAQDNADAGCLAAASAIRQGHYDQYDDRALEIIGRNQKFQGFNALEEQIIQVGRWDRYTSAFTALDPSLANKANAVRVVATRNEVPLFFAAIAGHKTTDVAREAIAMISPTCGGVWGFAEVDVPGNVRVDSYDSTESSYSLVGAGNNGDVCSNGPLTVAGSIEIYGDTLGDPVTVRGGTAYVDGYIDTLDSPVEPPVVDFGDAATNNDNGIIGLTDKGNNPFSTGWNMSIKANDNLTLPTGTFYFESVSFASGASLTLSGPTTIYLAGNFDETGRGTFNTTGDPHDLTMYSLGPLVHISGSASFYGSIMAPKSDVHLAGNADYYGALIGNDVKMNGNFKFHVDESLPVVHSLKPAPVLVK